MMRARAAALAALVALSGSALAQGSAAKVHRIGFLGTGAAAPMKAPIEALRAGLKEQGYVEGRNLHIEYRWGEDKAEKLAEFARELVAQKSELIVVWGTVAGFAAKRATSSVPIVMVNVGDPDETGLVSNLAHPGGNITGVANLGGPVVAKQLELLTQIVPGVTRLAVLRNPNNGSLVTQMKGAEAAAGRLRLKLEVIDVRSPADLEPAFARIAAARPSALLVLAEPMFVSERKRIAELALRHGLPAVSARSELADAGLLMTYGASATEQFRSGAVYVAKILRGAKPGDLPVEQAATFEFVINMKTAAALGVRVPDAIAARADRVVR